MSVSHKSLLGAELNVNALVRLAPCVGEVGGCVFGAAVAHDLYAGGWEARPTHHAAHRLATLLTERLALGGAPHRVGVHRERDTLDGALSAEPLGEALDDLCALGGELGAVALKAERALGGELASLEVDLRPRST